MTRTILFYFNDVSHSLSDIESRYTTEKSQSKELWVKTMFCCCRLLLLSIVVVSDCVEGQSNWDCVLTSHSIVQIQIRNKIQRLNHYYFTFHLIRRITRDQANRRSSRPPEFGWFRDYRPHLSRWINRQKLTCSQIFGREGVSRNRID